MNPESLNENVSNAAVGAANALPSETVSTTGAAADGAWIKLADYGDWPHVAGLQRLSRTSANEMTKTFKSLIGRLRRRFGGVPVYIGHPDDPGFAGSSGHDDTRAYAWVNGMDAREDGLYILPRWSQPGRDLLRHAFYKYLSPRWEMRPLSPGIFEPIRLLSVGLTNQPNIPGEAIANESAVLSGESKIEKVAASTTASEATPLSKPAAANAALLVRLIEALDFDASTPADAMVTQAEQLATAAAQTRDAQLESARFYRLATDADTARQAAEGKASQERNSRVELLLNHAVSNERITSDECAGWRDRFENDFEATSKALELEPSKSANSGEARTGTNANAFANHTPSAPITARLAERRAGAVAQDETARLLALVRERMSRTGEDYTAAWARVRRKNPGLFPA